MTATHVSKEIVARSPAQSTTEPTSEPVSLLKLPPELRLIIFTYVLVAHRPILDPIHLSTLQGAINHVFGKHKSITIPPELTAHTGDVHVSSAILSTCGTIYAEAWPVLYSQNIFAFTHPFWMVDFLSGRTRMEYRKAIRKVQLNIDATNATYRRGNRTTELSRDKTQFDEMEVAMTDWQYLFDTWATQGYSGIEKLCINFRTPEDIGLRPPLWKKTAAYWDTLTSLELSTFWEREKLVWIEGLTDDDALNRLIIKGDEVAGRVELTIARVEDDDVFLYKNSSVPAAHKGPTHKFSENNISQVLGHAIP
ncbi:MAG: hypothetical protein M1812_006530 [Candelaria pacifica]|nr:MAG: hypothetical protein M1812_006530 [Candelaria pacifica]